MFYKPHTLYKLVRSEYANDEFGRPLPKVSESTWERVCKCRCDDSGDAEIKMDDGTIVRPEWRVVLDGSAPDVANGDRVECRRDDGTVRGSGKVVKVKTLNYLAYAEIYLKG